MSKRNWCLNCFKIKGDYEVCPHCGFVEDEDSRGVYLLPAGTVLRDRYVIGQSIGLGGFGITYKAFDTTLGVIVAIKEFYPAGLVNRAEGESKVGVFSGEKAEQYKRQKGRFLEEARHMALFARERDIVNVYDYFEDNGTAYIIMEFVNGMLLKQYLQENGRMELEDACGCMISILEALQKIHSQGILHKDISPDNIFLMGTSQVKVFDFGAAEFENGVNSQLMPAVIKPGYAPPEQYRSKGKLRPAADIYAAGAVFYEMLTGVKPTESLDRMENDDLKKPSGMGIAMDLDIERAIMKALSLNPEERYASAEAFRAAILKETIEPEIPEKDTETEEKTKSEDQEDPGSGEDPEEKKNRKKVMIGILFTVVLAILLLVYFILPLK